MFRFEKDKSCLLPIDLFQIEVDIPFSKDKPKKFSNYQLPNFSDLFYTSSFAELGLYYNDQGIGGHLEVELPFTISNYPDFAQSDALEFFVSFKNMQQASSVSRFCHQFVIFPVEMSGFKAKEITHFRGDDSRSLFDPVDIIVNSSFEKKRYEMDFFIHKSSLYGFEEKDQVISFTYVVHAAKQNPQAFSVSPEMYSIIHNPSLWATGNLLKSGD